MKRTAAGIIDFRPLWRRFIAVTVEAVKNNNNNNNNNNNPGRGGTGGSGKVESCKDHDGAKGWELSRPTI